jgi:hypothetical protein
LRVDFRDRLGLVELVELRLAALRAAPRRVLDAAGFFDEGRAGVALERRAAERGVVRRLAYSPWPISISCSFISLALLLGLLALVFFIRGIVVLLRLVIGPAPIGWWIGVLNRVCRLKR